MKNMKYVCASLPFALFIAGCLFGIIDCKLTVNPTQAIISTLLLCTSAITFVIVYNNKK